MPPIDHVVGPKGKINPRADFREQKFANLVERSSRFVWERAMPCPCAPINDQTRQANPTCSTCGGFGYTRLGGPDGYVPDEDLLGPLSDAQKNIQARHNGVIIYGLLKSATMVQTAADKLGTWFWGQTKITVRPQNRITYYDRLFNLDSEISFYQLVDMPASGTTLELRYPAIEVHDVLDSDGRRWIQDIHFEVSGGDVEFNVADAPAGETRLAVRYLTFPSWIVTEYPHVIRATSVKRKRPRQEPQDLLLEAEVQLEYEIDRQG